MKPLYLTLYLHGILLSVQVEHCQRHGNRRSADERQVRTRGGRQLLQHGHQDRRPRPAIQVDIWSTVTCIYLSLSSTLYTLMSWQVTSKDILYIYIYIICSKLLGFLGRFWTRCYYGLPPMREPLQTTVEPTSECIIVYFYYFYKNLFCTRNTKRMCSRIHICKAQILNSTSLLATTITAVTWRRRLNTQSFRLDGTTRHLGKLPTTSYFLPIFRSECGLTNELHGRSNVFDELHGRRSNVFNELNGWSNVFNDCRFSITEQLDNNATLQIIMLDTVILAGTVQYTVTAL